MPAIRSLMFTLRRPYYTIRHIFVSLNDTDAVGLNLVRNKKLSGPRNHCRIDSAATPDAYAGEPSRDGGGSAVPGAEGEPEGAAAGGVDGETEDGGGGVVMRVRREGERQRDLVPVNHRGTAGGVNRAPGVADHAVPAQRHGR